VATVNAAGSMTRVQTKDIAATLSVVGATARSVGKGLSGVITAAGSIERDIGKGLCGIVSVDGSIELPRDSAVLASGTYPDPNASSLYGHNAAWADAWARGSASGEQTEHGLPSQSVIGAQKHLDGHYTIYRVYPVFDTSFVPAAATVIEAELFYAFVSGEIVTTPNTDMVIQDGQPARPSDYVAQSDFDKDFYAGDGGSANIQGVAGETYLKITLNATGRGWIQTGPGALTKLCLRTNRDINNDPPGTTADWAEYGRLYFKGGSYPMYLRVAWEV